MKLSLVSNITYIKISAITFVTIIYVFSGLFISVASDRFLLSSFYDKTYED